MFARVCFHGTAFSYLVIIGMWIMILMALNQKENANGGTVEFSDSLVLAGVNFVLCLVAVKLIYSGALKDPEPIVKAPCDLCGKEVNDRHQRKKKGDRYSCNAWWPIGMRDGHLILDSPPKSFLCVADGAARLHV